MRLFSRRVAKSVTPDLTVEVTESRGVRQLHLGTGAIQSAMRVNRPWDLELAYTRAMMGFLLFRPAPEDVLMIGLGGGSLAKFIRKHRPATRITAIEISPQVVAAARSHFLLPADDDRLEVRIDDGAAFVPRQTDAADVILLDGFDAGNQVERLATLEFYQACRRALKPGGVLVVNLWGRDAEFVRYLSRLLAAFDGGLAWLPVMNKTNVIVFGLRDEGYPQRWHSADLAQLGKRWGLDLAGLARDLHWARDIAPLLEPAA
jgi:spermidine synthase